MGKKTRKRRFLSSYEIEQEGIVSKLSEYYEYNKDNKVFEIPLHYEKASELYCENVEFREKPKKGGEGKNDFTTLPDKGRRQSASTSRTVPPSLMIKKRSDFHFLIKKKLSMWLFFKW